MRPEAAEMALIGIAAGAKKKDMRVLEGLRKEHFCGEDTRAIYAVLEEMLAQGDKIGLFELDMELSRRYGAVQGEALMAQVRDEAVRMVYHGWELEKMVKLVREAHGRRMLAHIGEEITRAACDETASAEEAQERALALLRQEIGSGDSSGTVCDACMEALEAAERQEKPIATGIAELDSLLCGGLHPGELSVLGARPAVGKSAALLYIARNAARQGRRVLFVSLEMSARQIGMRVLAANAGMNASRIRTGCNLDDAGWEALADALLQTGEDGSKNLELMVRGSLSVEALAQALRLRAQEERCELLVIDYLQLLASRQKAGSDFERLGAVSRALKGVTLEMNIPVLAAAQVKRQNNGGVSRAPGMDELRGSGDLEQDADNVLLLHCPQSPEDAVLQSRSYLRRHKGCFEAAQDRGLKLMCIEVAKQRQGGTGRAWTLFDPARMRFEA